MEKEVLNKKVKNADVKQQSMKEKITDSTGVDFRKKIKDKTESADKTSAKIKDKSYKEGSKKNKTNSTSKTQKQSDTKKKSKAVSNDKKNDLALSEEGLNERRYEKAETAKGEGNKNEKALINISQDQKGNVWTEEDNARNRKKKIKEISDEKRRANRYRQVIVDEDTESRSFYKSKHKGNNSRKKDKYLKKIEGSGGAFAEQAVSCASKYVNEASRYADEEDEDETEDIQYFDVPKVRGKTTNNGRDGKETGRQKYKGQNKVSDGKYKVQGQSNDVRAKRAARSTSADDMYQQIRIEKLYRQARQKGIPIREAMQEKNNVFVRAVRKIEETTRRNASLIMALFGSLIFMIALSAVLGACSEGVSQGTLSYILGMCPASDLDMTEADAYFTSLEVDLQEDINNIEKDYPAYDEYEYDLDEIGHDPTKLMAYLAAMYEDYTLTKVKSTLDDLFEEMYELDLSEEVRIDNGTVPDPITGEPTPSQTEVHILKVKLTKKDWDNLMSTRITDQERKELYEVYVDTGGAHQAYSSPFEFDWKNDISSYFGMRIHPISGEKKMHNGLDIAEPAGTRIKSVSTGTVTDSYYSDSAGNYVIVKTKDGHTIHYMHMNKRYVNAGDKVERGDMIGTVGSTGNSTGNHLHIGIKDKNGQWLNPFFLIGKYVDK